MSCLHNDSFIYIINANEVKGCVEVGRIHIVTDSTCDLTKEEVAQHNIHIVPLTIQIDGKTYIDGVDLEPQSFLGLMKNAKDLPKSS